MRLGGFGSQRSGDLPGYVSRVTTDWAALRRGVIEDYRFPCERLLFRVRYRLHALWLRGLSGERRFREVQLFWISSPSACGVVMKEVSNSDMCVRLSDGDLGAFTSTINRNTTIQFECIQLVYEIT